MNPDPQFRNYVMLPLATVLKFLGLIERCVALFIPMQSLFCIVFHRKIEMMTGWGGDLNPVSVFRNNEVLPPATAL